MKTRRPGERTVPASRNGCKANPLRLRPRRANARKPFASGAGKSAGFPWARHSRAGTDASERRPYHKMLTIMVLGRDASPRHPQERPRPSLGAFPRKTACFLSFSCLFRVNVDSPYGASFMVLSAARQRKIQSEVGVPRQYSPCCQKYGQFASSGKSGRMSAVPETMPPGMYEWSARFTP